MNIDAVIPIILQQVPEVQAIYHFGSTATGTANPNSDIDIAILSSKKLAFAKRLELMAELATVLKRDVDIVDLFHVSTVMQFQIISTGKRIYNNNFLDSEKFEDLTYLSYVRLNEERQKILEDIQKTGEMP